MSGTAVMENPMLSQSVSVAPAARSSRNAVTVPSLGRLVGQYANNVPYPLLFVAGAALGILFAILVVLFTHSTTLPAHVETKVTAFNVAAQPVAAWQPNVVVIHPAPVDPPMFDTPYAADPPSPAVRASANTSKKTVATRTPVRRAKAQSGNLLNAAL